MAEKVILVCDFCGRPAVAQRTLDVCTRHDAGEPKESPHFEAKACRYCEKVCGSGAGLAQHVKHAHPKRWKGAGVDYAKEA